MQRDDKGHFLPQPDSLGKVIGIRVKKDLEPLLEEIAAKEGVSRTEWCRRQVEAALAASTLTTAKPKTSVKKGKEAASSDG